MSGLHNAAITKGLLVSTGLNTLTASVLDIKPYLHLQIVPHMSKYHQYWRLFVHPLAFQNSTELVVGIMLLFQLSPVIERAFGPKKFAAFVLLASLVSTLLSTVALLALFPLFGMRYIPAGPYGLIFALLWQCHRIVPDVYTFRIFSIELSNKTFSHLLAAQLALSDPPASVLAASAGLLAGYIYRADRPPLPAFVRRRASILNRPLKTYRFSQPLAALFGNFLGPMLGSAPPPRRSHRTLPGEAGTARGRTTAASDASMLGALWNGRDSTRRTRADAVAAAVTARRAATLSPSTAAPTATAGPVSPAAANPAERPTGGVAGIAAGAGQARAAVGEWVSEMTGSTGARAPTEEEISTLSSMFPNISREAIVRALQRNDYNTAQAIEALLDDHS